MDDETINKNVKLFFDGLKHHKLNRRLFIAIFVVIFVIVSMLIIKHIIDSNPHYPTIPSGSPALVEEVNTDDEDWPDTSAKTRIFNKYYTNDLLAVANGLREYKIAKEGKLPYDTDTWKRAYRDYIRPLLTRDYTYDICDMDLGNCKAIDSLSWKEDKAKMHFAMNAVCSSDRLSLEYKKGSIATYAHLRGETTGTKCFNY